MTIRYYYANEYRRYQTYVRNYNGQAILVIANFHNCSRIINIPDIVAKKVIISNYEIDEINLQKLEIRPYEAIMFEI